MGIVYSCLHWVFQNLCLPWDRWLEPLGLVPLIVHRDILNKKNLLPAPLGECPEGDTKPPRFRPADGYGTDVNCPQASSEGAPFGRNCPALPHHLRNAHGDPDVQLVAQRLLAREEFTPAADQLNIMAAAWIQAMVHDWVGHFDDESETGGVELNKGAASGCPMASFRFKKTKARADGEFDNFRTMWWDASFVYGNNADMVSAARTMEGGKLRTNEEHPNTLPNDGEVNTTGDNKNSWAGVSLLQEIFLKEHNSVVSAIEEAYPGMYSDDELFGFGRNVIAALVAKVHTIDWTVELLKTYTLEIGMKTNWMGLPMALSSWLSFLPPFFRLIKSKSENHGVPFCLTEEFAAVYRLHPLLPPGLILGEDRKEFIALEDLVGDNGRSTIRESPDRVFDFWESCLYYPCGHLVPHNYPMALRDVAPTTDDGRGLPDHIDLAAIDLYRDRERGILRFNDFRRAIKMKPYESWEELVGVKNSVYARQLEAVYGPAPEGIEKCDLLVGDMYENKLRGFAISETSFIIFLLMASRRLNADPFLNEYYNEECYTKVGLDWVESVNGLKDLLNRHYPEIGAKIPKKQSAFKPYGPKKDVMNAWKKAQTDGVIPESIQSVWKDVKAKNAAFFNKILEGEATEKTSLL